MIVEYFDNFKIFIEFSWLMMSEHIYIFPVDSTGAGK